MFTRIQKNALLSTAALLLLSLMMIFIAQLYLVKILCMLIIIIFASKRIRVSKFVLVNIAILIVYGSWGTGMGIVYQNPDPFEYLGVFFFWPLFWLFFISYFSTSPILFKRYLKVLFISHIIIVLFDLFYALAIFNGFDIPNPFYGTEEGFSVYENSSRMTFINLNTLTFSTPILFILFSSKYDFGIKNTFQWLNIILSVILLIISGRRSVMLMCILMFFVPLLFSRYFTNEVRKKLIKVIFSSLIIVFVGSYYIESMYPGIIDGYYQVFLKAFDSEQEPVKFAQAKMFSEAITEKPLFGHGFGALFFEPAPGRIINSSYFELSYHQKLATTGFVGFIMIMYVFLSTLYYCFFLARKTRDVLFIAFAMGLLFMLIADATNPVLCSFDLMWPLYLCFAKINSYNSRNKHGILFSNSKL